METGRIHPYHVLACDLRASCGPSTDPFGRVVVRNPRRRTGGRLRSRSRGARAGTFPGARCHARLHCPNAVTGRGAVPGRSRRLGRSSPASAPGTREETRAAA